MKKKRIFLLIFLFIIYIITISAISNTISVKIQQQFENSKLIPVKAPENFCNEPNIITQGQGGNEEYVYSNNCIEFVMKTNKYDPNIDISDKYNNRDFSLILNAIEERDLDSNSTNTTTFTSLNLIPNITDGTLIYENEKYKIGYEIKKNSIKTIYSFINHTYLFNNSELWLKIKYHKNEGDIMTYLPTYVDGIEQPLVFENKTVGNNIFIYQKLGRGYHIQGDPIINVSVNTTVPSYHLINGTVISDNRDQFGNFTEISSTLSDGLDSNFSIRIGQDIFDQRLFFGFVMNEISGDQLNDFSMEDNNADLFNSPTLTGDGTDFTGLTLDGVNQYAQASDSPDFDINSTEHVLFCASMNTTKDYTTNALVLTKRMGNDGYLMRLNSLENIGCKVNRGTTQTAVSSTSVNTGRFMKACCFGNATSGEVSVYIDGVKENTVSGSTGSIANAEPFTIGSTVNGGSNFFNGTIDEVCGWKTNENNIDFDNLVLTYNTTGCINESLGIRIQPFFDYSINTTNSYSLQIESNFQDSQLIRVYRMINETNLNTSNFTDVMASGMTSFINIDSILFQGYNQPFGVVALSSENDNIDNIFLIETQNDTQNPSILDCSWDDLSVDCDDASAVTCNITDDSGVSSVIDFIFAPATDIQSSATGNVTDTSTIFSIGNNLFRRNHSQSDFRALLNNVGWNFQNFINFSITQVNATDTVGNVNATTFAVNEVFFEYVCTDVNAPAVTNLIPSSGSSFNFTDTIEIGADVVENLVSVDTVRANITFPNGTEQIITLSLTTGNKFNNSFTIPSLNGSYTVQFIANDTNNNINDTETTTFTALDNIAPADITNLLNQSIIIRICRCCYCI